MLNIVINEKPVPASRPRASRWGAYYNEPYNTYKQCLANFFYQFMRKKEPYEKGIPLRVDIDFYMPIPKSTSKKKTLMMENAWHTKTPDKDNLMKSVYDGMNKFVFYDDGQIVDGRETKKYSTNPRTVIRITKCI